MRKEMNGITKETFRGMDVPSKLDVLFDYVHEIQRAAPLRVQTRDRACEVRTQACERKFASLERRLKKTRLLNTAIVMSSSFLGGFVAVLTSLKFKMFGG